MFKKISSIIIASIIVLGLAHTARAQVQNQYWKVLSNILQPVLDAYSLKVPQLGGSGTKCLHVDNAGLFSTAAADCGSGSSTNYFTNSGANTYLNTGSNLEAPYMTATSTTASSTFPILYAPYSLAVGDAYAMHSAGTNYGNISSGVNSDFGSIRANGRGEFVVGHTELGHFLLASNDASFAFGDAGSGDITSSGVGTLSGGDADGFNITASGDGAIALGLAHLGNIIASGSGTMAIGDGVSATGDHSMAIGESFTNNQDNSFEVGYGQSDLHVQSGKVGLGTTTPGTRLSIGNTGNDTINISETSTSTFGSGLNIRTGCFSKNGVCLTQNAGTVTSVATNNGLTGGTITTAGTIGLNTTGLSPRALVAWDGSNLVATGTQILTVGNLIASTTNATSTFYGGVALASTTATTTAADGINLSGGCFAINGTCISGGSGAVSSVSNSDGTLTISPTTGSVISSLNLAHANTWSALQQFQSNASTTQLSVYNRGTFGATASSTFFSNGSLGMGTTSQLAQLQIATNTTSVSVLRIDRPQTNSTGVSALSIFGPGMHEKVGLSVWDGGGGDGNYGTVVLEGDCPSGSCRYYESGARNTATGNRVGDFIIQDDTGGVDLGDALIYAFDPAVGFVKVFEGYHDGHSFIPGALSVNTSNKYHQIENLGSISSITYDNDSAPEFNGGLSTVTDDGTGIITCDTFDCHFDLWFKAGDVIGVPSQGSTGRIISVDGSNQVTVQANTFASNNTFQVIRSPIDFPSSDNTFDGFVVQSSGINGQPFYVGINTVGILNNSLEVKGNCVVGASYTSTYTAPSNGCLFQGNVGINNTSPTYNLDVGGDMRASGALRDSSGQAGSYGNIFMSNGNNTDSFVATSTLYNASAINGFLSATTTASLRNKTATVSSVNKYTPTASSTYMISVSAGVKAVTADTLTITATYTDPNGTATTATFFPVGLTVAGLTTTGSPAFPPITITPLKNTQITVVATVTGAGSITYYIDASIAPIGTAVN